MKQVFLVLILNYLNLIYPQQSFEDFMLQEQQAFDHYKESVTKDYDSFKESEKVLFEKFKKDVEMQWEEFKGSTSKKYVSYDNDLQTRSEIDYDNGEILIEVILDNDRQEGDGLNYFNKPSKAPYYFGFSGESLLGNYLFIFHSSYYAFFQTAGHVRNELDATKTKPVFNKLADSKIIKKLVSLLKESDDNGNGILDGQLANNNGDIISSDNAELFAKEKLKEDLKDVNNYTAKDGKKRTSFSFKLKLKPDHKVTRFNKYQNEIVKQANRFNVDPAIAMAITEAESSFNPKATSHIPAYGLMQLVPESGARDAYHYIYKKDIFLEKKYLYKPSNNIELGCAYLAKIRYSYFKTIRDDEKAFMCTIAAYNTGVGNVAKALTDRTKLKPASRKANNMSSEKLYKTLLSDLEYEETRKYLKRVWTLKDKYSGIG
jgi:membrane-bound lytic murein transglycosylase C